MLYIFKWLWQNHSYLYSYMLSIQTTVRNVKTSEVKCDMIYKPLFLRPFVNFWLINHQVILEDLDGRPKLNLKALLTRLRSTFIQNYDAYRQNNATRNTTPLAERDKHQSLLNQTWTWQPRSQSHREKRSQSWRFPYNQLSFGNQMFAPCWPLKRTPC